MKHKRFSPLLLNNEGVPGDIVLRHVISGDGSRERELRSARENGGGEGRARSRDGSHEHRIGDGRVKAGGGGKRGGLKGSLAEILGKSSVKSHQNIPLAKTTTYSYHHCPLVSVVSA